MLDQLFILIDAFRDTLSINSFDFFYIVHATDTTFVNIIIKDILI